MADAQRKLDELHAVMVLAQRAASEGDVRSVARVVEEMHIQTGILLYELRKPFMPSAKVFDLAVERQERA
jgi:hypothetical protein